MKKINYNETKSELKKLCSNTKHFTKAFYNGFISAQNLTKYNCENEIDDSYFDGIIKKYHSFDPVYNSDFYRKNSCAYCEFLSIIYGKELLKA